MTPGSSLTRACMTSAGSATPGTYRSAAVTSVRRTARSTTAPCGRAGTVNAMTTAFPGSFPDDLPLASARALHWYGSLCDNVRDTAALLISANQVAPDVARPLAERYLRLRQDLVGALPEDTGEHLASSTTDAAATMTEVYIAAADLCAYINARIASDSWAAAYSHRDKQNKTVLAAPGGDAEQRVAQPPQSDSHTTGQYL